MAKRYTIGTRGSLLAITQCQQVRDQLEELTGDKFDLKIIRTQGDEQTQKPLWQLEGKDFFTKELDAALLKREIDLVVHSYKDLGSVRPEGIKLAAVTERFLGHDILLLRKEALREISEESQAIIGTSSPRRIVNIENNLGRFLPRDSNKNIVEVKTRMLRGNVNTRIQKCLDGQFHGIVLAFAGLERLASDPEAKKQLAPLLKDMTYLILPISHFPWAASQGALGIECLKERDDQNELSEKLSLLNHQPTIDEVKHERKAFNSYGGGCHLAVGVSVQNVPNRGLVASHLGEHEGEKINFHGFIRNTPLPEVKLKENDLVFLGVSSNKGASESRKVFDEFIQKRPKLPAFKEVATPRAFYATHPQTLEATKITFTSLDTLWVAGSKTHERALERGLWVNGSSDGLGEFQIAKFMQANLLKLMNTSFENFFILSHKDAQTTLKAEVLEAYQREENQVGPDFKEKIENCAIFYWTSDAQYEIYQKTFNLRADAQHFCGAGKTAGKLRERGVRVHVMSGMREFLQHIKLR